MTDQALQDNTTSIAKILRPADLALPMAIARRTVEFAEVTPGDVYRIEGQVQFDGWFLLADTLEFAPGGQLVFSGVALNERRSFYVVARTIKVTDPSQPGVITWHRSVADARVDGIGQAESGRDGGGDSGDSGGPGSNGGRGPDGVPGETAPNFTLIVLNAPSGGVKIDFSGGTGGTGGRGMTGGTGGKGGSGKPASQSAFGCKRGAGNGGTGGVGGAGGQGGSGGRGGAGGEVTLITSLERLDTMQQRFRVIVHGGDGGAGGEPGQGGAGGTGGDGGREARPYCTGNGATGQQGPAGHPGSPGPEGADGVDGEIAIGGVKEAYLLEHIFRQDS